MSTSYQIATTETPAPPAERIRRVGQAAGLWNHGFDFARACHQLFREIDFTGKGMLEIGCGKGVLCLWAALHGAREVIGLEPLTEGAFDTSECHREFQSMASKLGLLQAKILPFTIQDYDAPANSFDFALSVASINHLDEKNCVRLGDSLVAVQAYQKIFRRIARIVKPGGKLIIVDAARRNVFGDLGLRNPITPSIEWFKHQQPDYWASLLQECGFAQVDISWLSGRFLRLMGIRKLPKSIAYLGQSLFRLEMTRVR